MANIWGNGLLRVGNSVCKEGHTGHGKGRRQASVGRRAREDDQGDLERKQGMEARDRIWLLLPH